MKRKMPNPTNLLIKISRPEFLPANSSSLIIGFAWGLALPADLMWEIIIPIILAFSTITLVAAYAAQINTLCDYEQDIKDQTKQDLVAAISQYNSRKLRIIMISELSLSLVSLFLLILLEGKPLMLVLWAAAVFLAFAYSSPPLRLKARGILAPISLVLVLSILPVTFVAYSFTNTLGPAFWLFLSGQALTVYGVIVPAEIRDYFVDKKMGISTFTVLLGLAKASVLGIALLTIGGILCGLGLGFKLIIGALPLLTAFLTIMGAAYLYILAKYSKLLNLSRKHKDASAEKQQVLERQIIEISAKNPKWITLITQAIVLMCIVLLVSKLI